jgi:hypothetical protein
LAKEVILSAGNSRNQWVYCGTTDTSVDFPTPPADTDTAQIPLLRKEFLGKAQFIALMHALATEPPEHM